MVAPWPAPQGPAKLLEETPVNIAIFTYFHAHTNSDATADSVSTRPNITHNHAEHKALNAKLPLQAAHHACDLRLPLLINYTLCHCHSNQKQCGKQRKCAHETAHNNGHAH